MIMMIMIMMIMMEEVHCLSAPRVAPKIAPGFSYKEHAYQEHFILDLLVKLQGPCIDIPCGRALKISPLGIF